MTGLRARLDYILKHNPFFSKIFIFFASAFIRFLGLFVPMNQKSILFSAHARKYNDSPRALYEKIIKLPYFKDYRFYWAIDGDCSNSIPGNCTIVKPDTFSYFITALKCKYWITCVNIERGLRFKKRKCVFLNTWHGIPIKTVGNEAAGRKDYNFSYINFFCISGEYEKEVYFRSFNVKENQLLRVGMPRNDELYYYDEKQKEKIKLNLGLPLNKKIILYAPTWRDSKNNGKTYEIRPPISLDFWKEKLGNNYIVLFRTHLYTNKLLGIEFDDFVRDYSNYGSINDLLIISDVLISDYSATIFDYSILEKPIICFAYDLEEYSKDRGFILDVTSEMPCGIAKDETEVVNQILNMDYLVECKKVQQFKRKYLAYGGHSTDECIKRMFGEEAFSK